MNKSRAIWKKCLDCGGDSPKEVTLCPVFDCSLWPFRFGYSCKDKRFRERMLNAERNYPDDYVGFINLLSSYVKDGSNSSGKAPIDEVSKHIHFALEATLNTLE